MAFSKEKINKIIGKMKSKSNRNGIRESMSQVLYDILTDDELGQSHINPESAFRLIRAKSETELFVKTAAEVQQNEEWYVIADDSTGTFASKAKNYVKKDEDDNFIFETAKNSDVIVFYDDEHNDLDASNKHIRGIHVYEGGVWIAINARFTNYNSANSTASGDYSNVEGSGNTASGIGAHAEGNDNTASGDYSHTEGSNNEATEIAAHAEGSLTKALGDSAHAEGRLTVAGGAASSAHGYNTMTLPERTAIFGSHAKIGDPDTYFGVGFSANDYRDEGKTDANDYNLHLSVKKDGRVLNKDGKEFITADGIGDTIDGKLKVYSGESSDDTSTFTITQVKTNGWEFTLPSIIIEKGKNEVFVRWPADDDSFYNYLNSFLGQEIHLLESGENISTQSITFTGFGDVIEYTHGSGDSAVRYKQRTAHTTFSSSPDINIIPTGNTSTEYTFDVHSPIRLLVDNNTTHIRTIEQELTHSISNVGSDSSNSVRVVRKQGTGIGNNNNYIEAESDIVQIDEFYIVNPGVSGAGNISATHAGKYAIKNAEGVITYTSPKNGDMAFIYADNQADNTSTKQVVAILIYEGGAWVQTNSYFKNGNNITETGQYANAEGSATRATGNASHAEGIASAATASYSHAEGYYSDATAHSSHAEGRETTASGVNSHAEGLSTIASGVNSHAQGNQTTANKNDTAIMGRNGVVGDPNTVVGVAWANTAPVDADKTASVDKNLIWKVDTFGNTTQTGTVKASGFLDNNNNVIEASKFVDSITLDPNDDDKIKLGYSDDSTGVEVDWLPEPGNTNGNLSLLKVQRVGTEKRLLGSTSADVTAEINSLSDSTANNTKLRGTLIQTGTIAEETLTTAVQTKLNASGGGSDTTHFVKVVRKEGDDIGNKDYYVENIAEIEQTDEFYIVNPKLGETANGADVSSTNPIITGDIPTTNKGYYAIKGSDGTITYTAPRNGDTAFIYADKQRDITDGDGNLSTTDENKIEAIIIYEGGTWIITNSYFKNANNCNETGAWANAEGWGTDATGVYSHAEGNFTDATGHTSHAEGRGTVASGPNSHAEGFSSTASGITAHAEGSGTASGDQSHAQGLGTLASGNQSHAEGNLTKALGADSHAQGHDTVAKTDHSTISGQNGVVANPTTLIGIAWGATAPLPADYADGVVVDKDLVWKVDQSGNTTQTGKVIAASFEKPDGTTIAKGDKGDPGEGSGNAALEALTRDMEWKVEVQEYDNAETPASPATIGIAYSGTYVDFVFPTATSKADVDALVIDRNFAFELPEGIVAFTPTAHENTATHGQTHHRERYAASITLDTGVAATSNGNNNYQTTLYRSTIGHTIILPNPGTNEGAKDIPIVKRVNGELILVSSTSAEVIEEINGISPGSANNDGLQGHVLKNATIPVGKLDSNVQSILNLSAVYGADIQANTSNITTNTENIAALPGRIKIKERTKRVFASSALKTDETAQGGWLFKGSYTSLLAVGNLEETPTDLDTLQYKGLSIAILKTEWNKMDKIVVTVSHGNQIAYSPYFIYKEDIPSGEANKVRFGISGTGRTKMNIYFEESKTQEGTANNDNNRLVIEMSGEAASPGFYIGEVLLQHLETTTTS